MKNSAIMALLGVLLITIMAGCGQQSVEEAESQVCSSLAELRTALAGLTNVTADTEVETAQAAVEQVRTAWNNVSAAAETLQEARANELQNAYDQYTQAVDDIPGSATLGEAGQTIAQAATQFNTEVDAIYGELNCE